MKKGFGLEFQLEKNSETFKLSFMELNLYILSYILAMAYAISPKLTTERNLIFIWLGFTLLLSFVIRAEVLSQKDAESSDMAAYLKLFSLDAFSGGLHFIKEFIFWALSRGLFTITQNSHTVFFILDFICVALIYTSFRNLRKLFFPSIAKENIVYSLFGFLLFFPVVVGYQATYRQFFATLILMFSLSYIVKKGWFKSFLIFCVSLFSHNAVIICAPFIVMIRKNRSIKLFLFLLLCIPIIYFIFSGNDENSINSLYVWSDLELGKKISHLCLLVIILINSFGLIYRESDLSNNFNQLLIYIMVTFIVVWMTFNSEAVLRFFYLFLTLLFPLAAFYIENKYNNLILPRLIFLNVTAAPLIFLPYGQHIML